MNDDISQMLLDNLSDGIYYVGKDRVITYWNKTAEDITGYSKSEILGRSCANNILRHMDITGKELCENGCPLQSTIQDGQPREALVFLHHKKGHRVSVHVRVTPIRDSNGVITGAVETFSDNSKDLDMLNEIEYLKKGVFQDPLLKIGNRRFADVMFERYTYKQDMATAPLGVIFIDIDSFKTINDLYGHSIGDDVLIMVSQSIMSALRQSDSFFRWGGDEFLILLPNTSPEGLKSVAERVNIFVERSYIAIGENKISVTTSAGATFVKGNESLESVVKRSDSLMYIGKRNGRNKFTVG
jgi:diguanylate cyclase (GGDEF)-like protein/PAS domain S-box-containing protein